LLKQFGQYQGAGFLTGIGLLLRQTAQLNRRGHAGLFGPIYPAGGDEPDSMFASLARKSILRNTSFLENAEREGNEPALAASLSYL
jgi:hypothetical protein